MENNQHKGIGAVFTILIKGILICLIIAISILLVFASIERYRKWVQHRSYYQDEGISSANCVANMEILTSALNEYNKKHDRKVEQLCMAHDLAKAYPILAKKYLDFNEVELGKGCKYFLILGANNKAIVVCSAHGALKFNK